MNVAIVGYGVMGKHHARVLRALGCKVTGVDPVPGIGDVTSIGDTDATLAVVSTPIPQLYEAVTDCYEWGVDIMLIEKPGAMTANEAETIADTFPEAAVGFIERFNPAVQTLRQHLYRVGKILDVSTQRIGGPPRYEIRPSLDLLPHDLDLLEYIGLLPDPRYIQDGRKVCNVALARGSMTVSHAHPRKMRVIRILGTEAELVADLQRQKVTLLHPGGWVDLSPPKCEPLTKMWSTILEDGEYPTMLDASRVLRTIEGICHTPDPA